MRSVARFIWTVLLILATSIGLWAQAGTGSITGLISDPSGAVVLNAQVTLTNEATGVVRATKPTSAGVYTFSAVTVGSYRVTVEAPGFTPFKAANVVVSTGTAYNLDVRLQVGTTGEQVEVQAGAMGVQTNDSSVSQLIGQDIWGHMPLEVRNQNSYINLVAGATPDVVSTRGASVNGARGGTGNYMVEGMDNNDQGQGGRGQIAPGAGGAVTQISPDAIQEYRVITNSFAAEYGKAGGFITDTVIKSGTNKFHGSLFEYNRIQALAAEDWFTKRAGNKDRLVRNQFGGSIGGPIIKDKTFFFGQLEFHRMRQAGSTTTSGTTQQYLDWVNAGGLQQWAESSTSGICNNQAFLNDMFGTGVRTAAPCVGAFAAVGKTGQLFNQMIKVSPFPVAPNTTCAGGGCVGEGYYTSGLNFPVPIYNTLTVADPYHVNEYKIVGKFDHRFSEKDAVSYIFIEQSAKSGSAFDCGNSSIGPACVEEGKNIDTGITWNHSLSNTVLNTLKLSYLRHRQDYSLPNSGMVGLPGFYTYYDELGVATGMYSGMPQPFTDQQFQLQNHLSFVKGTHSFKTGMEYRRIRNASQFHLDDYGTFAPFAIEDYVTDLAFTDLAAHVLGIKSPGSAYVASAAVDMSNGKAPDVYRGYRSNEASAYFQDDWRMHPRFTLNWGLRWEYFGVPHNFKPNVDSNYYFGPPTPTLQAANLCTATVTTNCHTSNPWFPISNFSAMVQNGGFQVRNNEIWNKNTGNFGPRLGFSWDVLGNQKLVLRSGYGIMFDRLYNNVFENIRFNPPFFSDNTIGYGANGVAVGSISSPGILTFPFTSNTFFSNPAYAPKPNPRHMDQNIKTAYSQQFHLGFQYEFAKGYVFEPEFVATRGGHLTGYYDINTFDGRTACTTASSVKAGTPCANAGITAPVSSARISNVIGADNFRTSGFWSNYYGLQLSVRKNYNNGLSFMGNYTHSKTLDTLSDVFNLRGGRVTDVMNIGYDYGPADFDIRDRFVGNLVYDLPFFKGNRWIGDWSISTIFSMQSGAPFSPYSTSSGYDLNKDGNANDRVVTVGGVSPASTKTGKEAPNGFFDKTKWTTYACPTSVNSGIWCNVPIGRNSMNGPGFWNQDLGITKRFKITETMNLAFSGNFFNLYNHPNFAVPVASFTSSNFGKSTSMSGNPRITQLSLRFDF